MSKDAYFRFRISSGLLDKVRDRTGNVSDYIRNLVRTDLELNPGESAPAPRTPWVYHARLIRVVDGDTLELELDVGFEIALKTPVRLLGVSAPELNTNAGKTAKKFLERRLRGAHLIVETRKRGKYGRYLGRIHYHKTYTDYADIVGYGRLINDELIENGHAKKA